MGKQNAIVIRPDMTPDPEASRRMVEAIKLLITLDSGIIVFFAALIGKGYFDQVFTTALTRSLFWFAASLLGGVVFLCNALCIPYHRFSMRSLSNLVAFSDMVCLAGFSMGIVTLVYHIM